MDQTPVASQTGMPIGRQRFTRILVLCALAQAMNGMDRGNVNIAMPVVAQEWGLAAFGVSLVLSSYAWGYLPMQFVNGIFGKRASIRWLLTLALLGWSIPTFLSGFTTDVNQLIACRVFIGIAEGPCFPMVYVLLSRYFPREERSRSFALMGTGSALSGILWTPLGGFLIGAFGWRSMFIIEAIPSVIVAIALFVFLGDRPATDRRMGEGERQWLLAKFEAERVAEGGSGVRSTLFTLLKNPRLWAATIMYTSGTLVGVAAFLPTMVSQATHLPITSIGLLVTIPTILGLGINNLNARLSDRAHSRIVWGLWPSAAVGLFMVLSAYVNDPVGKLIILSLAQISDGGRVAITYAWGLESVPDSERTLASAFMTFIFSLTAIVGPLAIGLLAGNGPLIGAFGTIGWVPVACAVIAACLVMLGRGASKAAPTPVKTAS